MSWREALDELPLAFGLQLRNIALSEGGVKILPPGKAAFSKAREILGDNTEEWLSAG